MTNSKGSSTLRQAAILIRSLDADLAAQLLARLSPSEVRALRVELRDLGSIEDGELETVADAILNPCSKSGIQTSKASAVELELGLNQKSAAFERREKLESPHLNSRKDSQLKDLESLAAARTSFASPFQSIIESDIVSLSAFLECEHAQTIAVVFSYLPPNKAAQALAALSEGRQADVIHRLSRLRDADPATLDVVERSLESWLAEQRREQQRRLDRMSIIRSILNNVEDRTRQTIFTRLRQSDWRLAEQIESHVADSTCNGFPQGYMSISAGTVSRIEQGESKSCGRMMNTSAASETLAESVTPYSIPKRGEAKNVIEIDELLRLSDDQLTSLVNCVEPRVLHCALASASEVLLDRICVCLSRNRRRKFQREIRCLGTVSLRDLEAAKRVVSECASRIVEAQVSEPLLRAAA